MKHRIKRTFAAILPRQHGKTTFLLKQAAKDGDAHVLLAEDGHIYYVSEVLRYIFAESVYNKQLRTITLKNGNTIKLHSTLCTVPKNGNLYIDELTEVLSQDYQLKGYTDTALRVSEDQLGNPMVDSGELRKRLDVMWKGGEKEDYQLEVLAKWVEADSEREKLQELRNKLLDEIQEINKQLRGN